MSGCESWTIKKAEHQRIDAFELWCWRRLMRVPWTARRSNQSIHPKGNQSWIFMGRTDVEAEAPILWPFDVKNWLIGKRPWCWVRLRVGREGDDRGWDGWMASPTWWTWVWARSGCWWWAGKPGVLQSMGLQRIRHNWETELNWPGSSVHGIFQASILEWVAISYSIPHPEIERTSLVSPGLDGRFFTTGAWEAHTKKEERSHINKLIVHLREPEKEEWTKPKFGRRKEIIKIRTEIK